MITLKRKPTHPGEILKKEFLEPLRITQSRLAKEIHTTFRTVNEIVNERRNISPEMAIRLSRYFGTSEELWLNLQSQYDLYAAKERRLDALMDIKPFKAGKFESVGKN